MQETNILVSESSGLPTTVSSQGPACPCTSPGQEFGQEMLLLGSRASSELAGKIHPRFNCSFRLWMGPLPSQGTMGMVDTYPLVQLIRTWASVVSLFARDNQGC